MKLYHGDIVYTRGPEAFEIHENAWIGVENGKVAGIYHQLPEAFRDLPVTDYGRGLIIPAFTDLHVHAPQYAMRGTKMDLLLSDWLATQTFPEEAKFHSRAYAEAVYTAFADDLVKQGTLHAVVFGTIHRVATGILMEELEKRNLSAYVGKVSMDRGAPGYLTEDTADSLAETQRFLYDHQGNGRVKPILTPRFAPTCSREQLMGLGKLGQTYGVGMQTHLVESRWEAAEALRLFPECGSDAEIYEKAGLLENGPVIFAHTIFPTPGDLAVIKRVGATTVHCPDATNNVIAGIMPAAALMGDGVRVTLGSDVGAGHGLAIYKQVARTVQLSKLKEFYEPEGNKSVPFHTAFYMATKASGELFGRVGSFEEGYDFDALVIDGVEDGWQTMSPADRLERFSYTGDDRNIIARFIRGKAVGEV
ncbi:MAG: amidohydrolase family protein [Clostridia bacterium]|nr:amidohydrolase family protein [Clostridia bacterium]